MVLGAPESSTRSFVAALREAVGAAHLRSDASSLEKYSQDALGIGHLPDLVVAPANTDEIAAVVRLCNEHRVPLVVRGLARATPAVQCPRTAASCFRSSG
jgi:glycolate oxidase